MDPRIQIRIRIHPKMSWIRNTDPMCLPVFWQNEALVNQFPVGNHAGLNRQEAEARLLEDFNQLVTIMLREESLYSGIPGVAF
jgi:hypothetical protein